MYNNILCSKFAEMEYLRVISGTAKGTKLVTLSGDDVIRPTTDRVKESVFNIIQFNVKGANILDIFCGSGALGIEALSRGSSFCCFVDSNRDSLKIAENNIKKAHVEAYSKLIKADFRDFFSTNTKKYDIIFADPPYAAGFLKEFVTKIEKYGALQRDGILIFEAPQEIEPYKGEKLAPYRIASYGKTQVIFYRYMESE